MKQRYAWLFKACSLLFAQQAVAQIPLASTTPYTQDFNSLNGKTVFASNSTIQGVYIEYAGGRNWPCLPNDGSNTGASFYHFGAANDADRALGGVASFTVSGTGYVGMRFKNTTGAVIRNLGVSFAIEQWYNSGRQDAAQVSFDYLTSTATTGITGVGGTTGWTNVPALNVDAPSTSTVIDNKNGNSSANRRTRTYTIQDINLAPEAEVMLRWRYELNNATNGNGLSVDDVTISPETNVYYYRGTGNLNDVANWSSRRDGTVADLTNFKGDGRTYYILSSITDDRISGNWKVEGTNSKVVLGDGIAPAYLLVGGSAGGGISATLDVLDNATLEIQRGNGQLPTLGRIANKSTVQYIRDGNDTPLTSATYGNLLVDGTSPKLLTSSTIVNGDLTLRGSSVIVLGNNDLTIIRGGKINGGDNNAFIRTNGTGVLKQNVLADGIVVKFPVGVGATYSPAYLRQTASRSEDVFSVQVQPGLFARYAGRAGTGTAVSNRNVNRTWFVEEEVPGSSDVTLQLQWPAAAHTPDFTPTAARLEHYSTTTNTWDNTPVVGATSPDGGVTYSVTRTAIKSFSPFGVSSRPGGPLPVQLVGFLAQRQASQVLCQWQTAAELNNRHFVVERSSTGQHFTAIGTVGGRGTTTTGQHYQFLDAAPLAGVSYYRLRQVDVDGTEAFSGVVVVGQTAPSAQPTAHVTPNPGTGQFQLMLPTGVALLEGEVLNVVGARVQTIGPDGRFSLTARPSGVYILRVRTTAGLQTLRFVQE